MERLTYWCDDGKGGGEWRINVCGTEVFGAEIDRLAAYEDAGLEPEDFKKAFDEVSVLKLAGNYLGTTADRLRELVQAEKDGRLAVLPVPVGAGKEAYGIYDMEPFTAHIEVIDCDHFDGLEIFPTGEVVVEADGWEIGQSDIGETVFLTREEAEAALGGSENA